MSLNEEKPTPLSTASASKQGFINFMVQILDFTPRSKREIDLSVLDDWRSGIRVLACDSHYDVAEPHATELVGLMERREIGFGHAWRLAEVSMELMRELDRVRLPMRVLSGVVIMARDFRVVGELPPDDAAVSEPTRLAA